MLHSSRLEPEEVVMLTTLIEPKRDKVQDVILTIPKIKEEIDKIKDGKISQEKKVIIATRTAFLKLDVREKHGVLRKLLRGLLPTS